MLAAVSVCLGLGGLAGLLLLPAGMRTEVPKKDDRPHRPGVSLPALLLAVAGRTLGLGFLAAFYPILLAATLGRGMRVALLFAAPGLATVLLLPLAGRLFQNRSGEGLTLTGMLLSAGAMFLAGQAHTDFHFLLAGAAMGAGSACPCPRP